MVSVLTAGHVNWDVTLRVDRLPEADGEASIRSQRQSGGGSAANVAVALGRLDVSTGLIASVGDDDNGLLARRELEQAGIDLSGLLEVPGATSVKYLLVDDRGRVSILGNDGVNEAVTPDDVDADAVRAADHVHLTAQRPATATAIAEIASEAGIPVSFDPGRRLGDRDFERTLDLADVLFLTAREAEFVFETDYADSQFADRTVVVTDGADGATLYTPSERYTHEGFDVEPVDATGAGDAFAAGYIAATRRSGDTSPAAVLRFANACGALAAGRDGARSAPALERVEEFLTARRSNDPA